MLSAMLAFAALLDRLTHSPSRNAKLQLLNDHFASEPDPERGLELAALTGELTFQHAKPHLVRELVAERVDPILFELSYDYVGDLAETVALIWPERGGANRAPSFEEVVDGLENAPKAELPRLLEHWFDALDSNGRWALIKLVTRSLRVGVSARLAKTALAQFGTVDVQEIEEIWHGLTPPYRDLFAWLEGRGPKPAPRIEAAFRPPMLATSFADVNRQEYDPADYLAEWKWDGIRVQLASEGKTRRLYSRTGDDISETFPDVLAAFEAEGVIDGELLITTGEVGEDGLLVPAPFSELQKRLNRKTVDRKLMDRAPAFVRAYDLLDEAGTDRRGERFDRRRAHLEAFVERAGSERLDLSPLIAYQTWEELDERRVHPPEPVMEGVMLKRKDSLYVPGRPKGPWFKWKRDPFLIDAVLMYAQRGHGKRSSFYSDYTFGVWRTLEEGTHDLVPVGKAYFGFTDEELKALDSFVRNHTTDRFGPVRQVAMGPDTGLVLEIAFEGLNPSSRHKSGVAMRFPRIHRIRWDKPAGEADTLETVKTFLPERSSAP